MSPDVLWAGWRMEYIRKASARGKSKEPCLFCSAARLRPGPRNHVVARTGLALVMLNRYPYSVGHMMVATRRHTASLADVTREESVEIAEWLGRLEQALAREYEPRGFNIGINLGRVAGAGVLGHLHWHIVPRWDGDTNFMPVTANSKVLPESLDRTYRRVVKALAAADRRTKTRARR